MTGILCYLICGIQARKKRKRLGVMPWQGTFMPCPVSVGYIDGPLLFVRTSNLSNKLVGLFRIAAILSVLISSLSAAPRQTADRIVVLKSARTMSLYSHDKLIKQYKIALGGSPAGPKQQMGDHKTPEGSYVIDSKNAHSQFHLSLHISYPNGEDRNRARQEGVAPGGAIMIHGLPARFHSLGALHRQWDWTDGCIAVTDEEIEEIWSLVPIGTKIEILP